MKTTHFIMIWLLMIFACALGGGCSTTAIAENSAWCGQKPVVVDDKIVEWVEAPEFLSWRQADPERDGFSGLVVRVSLTGPFHQGAWSQHAGAIWQLPQMVPKGEPFTVRFKARSLEGPPHLTVLRAWGGAKPWETIGITNQWRDYEVTLEPQSDTTQVTFSLAPKKGRLQPYCAGVFEVAAVTIDGPPGKPKQSVSAPRGDSNGK